MAHYSKEWWYSTGQLATNQRAIVFGPGDDNAIATIYADAGLVTPLANPTTTDPVTGVLDFYVPDGGTYWVYVGPVNNGDSELWNAGANPDNPVLSVNGVLPDGTGDVELDSTDIGAQPIATINAKGDIYAGTGDNATTRLGVGADGDVLTADSGEATGMKWAPGGGGGGGIPDTIIDAKGDLIAGTAPDTPARLAVGGNGQTLRANSATPTGLEWDTLTAADVGADPAGSAAAAQAAAIAASLQKTANLSDLTNATTARTNLGLGNSATRNVGTTAGTVAAGDDARITGAIQSTLVDAKGDIVTATANDTPARLAVGADGRVLTANSAQATGLEWTVPPSAPVSSVNGKVGAVVLDATDVGAAPTGRVLTAGTGLSGGGDLSADRAFSVDYGVTAGTVAEGNDSRITGAQQRSTVTVKGDIYAATASATTTRLAVGTDGQALRANSGTATGLEWDTLTASDVGADPAGSAAAAQAASQPLDADLTAIAALAPSNDDIIQRKAGVWTNRTVAQYKTDLAYTAAQVGAIANALVDAKGDLITATANDTPARLAVGGDGLLLSANSAQPTGLEWVAAPSSGIPATIFDAKGDLIAASAADTAARLAVGSNGQALRANSATSTGLEWDTLDAADVGAIASTLVDAKGDIVTATANDTPARLAVGTNGYSLAADSAASTGLKWDVAKTAGVYPRSTGYVLAGGVGTTRSSKSATLNLMYLIPFMLLRDATLSSIAFEVSANIATAVVRLGVYGVDSSFLPTGAAVADYNTTAADTTGTKTAAVSTALTAGLWYLAFVGQTAAPTIRHGAGFSPFVASATFPSGSGIGWDNAWTQASVSGSLPTIGALTASDSPVCGVKF